MDKKSIYAFVFLIGFIFLWEHMILDLLPEWMRPPKPQPVQSSGNIQSNGNVTMQQGHSGNTNTLNSGNTSEIIDAVKNTIHKTHETVTNNNPEVKENIVKFQEEVVKIETDEFIVELTNQGGRVSSLSLKKYHPTVKKEKPLLLINQKEPIIEGMTYKVKKEKIVDSSVVTFTNENEKRIYTFKQKGFFFNLQIEKFNTKSSVDISLPRLEEQKTADIAFARTNKGAIYADSSRSYGDNSEIHAELNETPITVNGLNNLMFAGFRDKYFAYFIEPGKTNKATHSIEFKPFYGKDGLLFNAAAREAQFDYNFYAGPINKEDLFSKDEEKYKSLFNYTGFDIVIHFLLMLLNLYSGIPGINMGIAILLLTLTVKAILFPLNVKAQSSMFMMSKLGPKMKEMQEKYKDDRQQLGMAQMKLFKDNGVNPMAGCLPMVIQMPVFISLFSTIGEGFALRHSPFIGWIKDLSAPDQIAKFGYDIVFIGNGDGTTNVNALVFLYVVTMLIQQSMMPKSTDPNQQQMQKSMKFMMIFFAVLLYNYSSGLMLYFVTSNVLGMLESRYIKTKILPRMEKKAKKAT